MFLGSRLKVRCLTLWFVIQGVELLISLPIAPSLASLPPPKSESRSLSSLVGILSQIRVQNCVWLQNCQWPTITFQMQRSLLCSNPNGVTQWIKCDGHCWSRRACGGPPAAWTQSSTSSQSPTSTLQSLESGGFCTHFGSVCLEPLLLSLCLSKQLRCRVPQWHFEFLLP